MKPSRFDSKALSSMTDAEYMTFAREHLGPIWGLGRAITKREMARALGLSDKHGSSYVGKVELSTDGKPGISGPTRRLINAWLAGWPPEGMDDIVKPGYPRGPVR